MIRFVGEEPGKLPRNKGGRLVQVDNNIRILCQLLSYEYNIGGQTDTVTVDK